MDMQALINDPDAWNETWEATPSGERQAFLLETIREELPEDFDYNTDLTGILLDWLGPAYESEKKFGLVISFLEEYRKAQPRLFKNEFHYFSDFLKRYYFFTGEKEKIKPVYQHYLGNPALDVDFTLDFHRELWLWGYDDWAGSLARKGYLPVEDDPDITDSAGRELATAVLADALDQAWQGFSKTGKLDLAAAKKAALEFGFDMDTEAWDMVADTLCREPDCEQLNQELSHKEKMITWKLEILFQKYMRQRGMHFHVSFLIFQDVMHFWQEKSKGKSQAPERYFLLDRDSFEQHLARKERLFSMLFDDMSKSLWGVVFVYDFLLATGLISGSLYQSALQNVRSLKATVLHHFSISLWKGGFIHKVWQKPDGIPASGHEAEATLFEESFLKTREEIPEADFSRRFSGKVEFGYDPFEIPGQIMGKDKPAYEKQPRPAKNPAKAAARKRRKKKKK
jgi:hypothetical protein